MDDAPLEHLLFQPKVAIDIDLIDLNGEWKPGGQTHADPENAIEETCECLRVGEEQGMTFLVKMEEALRSSSPSAAPHAPRLFAMKPSAQRRTPGCLFSEKWV